MCHSMRNKDPNDGNEHACAHGLQFDTRRTPAPQVSLKSQDALSHSYHTARHECNVNRARAEGDTEVHFYHGEQHVHVARLCMSFSVLRLPYFRCNVNCTFALGCALSASLSNLSVSQRCSCQGQLLHPSARDADSLI